jgi:hypothetical protein
MKKVFKVFAVTAILMMCATPPPACALKATSVQDGLEELRRIDRCVRWVAEMDKLLEDKTAAADESAPAESASTSVSYVWVTTSGLQAPYKSCVRLLIEYGLKDKIGSTLEKLRARKSTLEIKDKD